MFAQLLIAAIALEVMTLVRLLRRIDRPQRGYSLLCLAVLMLGIGALVQRDVFFGTVAIALTTLTIVVPWLLETLAREAFSRGRLRVAVWSAGLRALLMPGAGLGRQQEILHGLELLERRGADVALAHFRELAGKTENGGELALIHEQIVSMLFYEQKWHEGIAHYEGRFHPAYAAMRPALALGLLRAYGESGRLNVAAGLLRALEEGPIGADPRAVGMVSQARLTFLAYAGAAAAVDDALRGDALRLLSLSPATAALYRGIAWARSGEAERAHAEFARVTTLAGPTEQRIVAASKTALSHLSATNLALEPDLDRYAVVVAERLQRFLRAAPSLRRVGPLVVTPLIITTLVVGYSASMIVGEGAYGLQRLGALTPGLWHAGAWGRTITGAFVHADALVLLLDAYAVWLGGPIVERIFGSVRLATVAMLALIAGSLAAVALAGDPSVMIGSASLMASGVLGAGFTCLLPHKTPALGRRARMALLLPLGLVLLAVVFAGLPGVHAMVAPPLAHLVTLVIGSLAILAARNHPRRWVASVFQSIVGVAALATAFAVVRVSQEDIESYAIAHRDRSVIHDGVHFQVPAGFEVLDAPPRVLPPLLAVPGLVDTVSLAAGRVLVWSAVKRDTQHATSSALIERHPDLLRELSATALDHPPPEFAAGQDDVLRAFALRRNGRHVATTIERTRVTATGHTTIVLFVSPPEALDDAPALLAAISSAARVIGD